MTRGRLQAAGVIGWPVRHSLSPLIHRIWAAREKAEAAYVPIEAEPGLDAFRCAVDALRACGFSGVNVTIPHKQNALLYATTASAEAKAAGAANMLTFSPDGTQADNSDVEGFRKAADGAGGAVARRKAVVLGAGGAARAVVLALKSLGFPSVAVINRTRARADDLAQSLGAQVDDWMRRESALGDADLLVNATSLGMTGQPPLDLRLDALPKTALVADIVYAPLATPLLQAARARGNRTADGLSMLMHQAVPAYERWLGSKAVVDDALRARLEREISRRAS